MKKMTCIVYSEETNKVGIYERENGEVNCLVSYDASEFDAEGMFMSVVDRYVFRDEKGEDIDENAVSEEEYKKLMATYDYLCQKAVFMDAEEFEKIMND